MSLWPNPTAPAAQASHPWHILNEYASQLKPDTGGKFEGRVTETVQDEEVTYALYILVPEMRDYMYRLFEARLDRFPEPYPVTLRLFAKDPRNHQTYSCGTPETLRQSLEQGIRSPITELLLQALTQQINIMKHYRDEVDEA
jgi:hypothetical protein